MGKKSKNLNAAPEDYFKGGGAAGEQMREFDRANTPLGKEDLERILSSLNDGFVAFDREWRYTYVNDAATRITGLSKEDFLGKTIWEVFSDTIGEKFHDEMQRAVREKKPRVFEYFYPKSNRWFENRVYPTMGGAVVFTSEITERKRTEGISERYRLLSEKANDVIWLLRPDGQIVEVNEAAVETYGYSREELLRMNVKDLREKSTLALLDGQLKLASESGLHFETVHVRKDGRAFPVEVNATMGDFGGERFLLSIVRDITERKQSELDTVFLSDLGEKIRRANDVDELLNHVCASVAKHFGVSHCGFSQINLECDSCVNYHEYRAAGVASTLGEYRLSDYPKEQIDALAGGQTILIDDAATHPQTAANYETAHKPFDYRAYLSQPVMRNQVWVGTLFINDAKPRHWTEREINLLGVVAERAWLAAEKLRNESALRESEERYRILAETASDAIIRIDENSTIQYVNTAAGRIFGYAAEEMIGQSLTMLMPEEMRERHRAGFGRYLETGKRNLNWESIEVPARHKTGRLFPLEISFGEYNRGGRRFFIGIARDITERRAAEQAMRESEEKFRDLANSISQFAWMADASGYIFWYNERWFEYTGTTHEEMQGWGWQAVHHAEEIERVTEKFKRHIASGEIWEDTFPLRSKTGEYRWFLSRALPIRDEQGRIVRWFGTNTDVEELRQARLQAEAANRLKDEFLATVSHELRTPLNAILGWSEMLKSGKATGEITVRGNETIYRSAISQAQLIEDLLDVSRIITGKMKLEPRPVQFAPIVEAAVNTLRPAVDAKSIELKIDIDCEPCLVGGDEQRLQQVVWNLISNAVKFTPEGGRVEVKLENENSHARLIVSDTGKGIEAEFLPFMFQRFRQEDASSTRRHGGLGLGLAIVRHLVELHGGTIRAASAGENLGATFTVELPLISAGDKPTNNEARNLRESLSDGFAGEKNAPKQLSGAKVLLVDDEQSTLEILDFALSDAGAEVHVASSAADAFEILQSWQPDVLVSDIAMPDEDGYSLIKKVRELAPDKGGAIPAIAMTAYVRVEDRTRVLASGFQMYVPKPAEPTELINAIANLIGEKKP